MRGINEEKRGIDKAEGKLKQHKSQEGIFIIPVVAETLICLFFKLPGLKSRGVLRVGLLVWGFARLRRLQNRRSFRCVDVRKTEKKLGGTFHYKKIIQLGALR